MKFYFIIPSVISGYAIVSESSSKQYHYPAGMFPKGDLVMIIDSYDWHKHLFKDGSSSFFVTSWFKKKLIEENFQELDFRNIDKLIIDENLEENFPTHGFTKNSFCKLIILPNGKHFIKWKNYLIVSERALNFLYTNDAFQEFDEGISLGEEYSLVTNKFLIDGNFEEFFLQELPKINEEIKEKRKINAALRKSMRNK